MRGKLVGERLSQGLAFENKTKALRSLAPLSPQHQKQEKSLDEKIARDDEKVDRCSEYIQRAINAWEKVKKDEKSAKNSKEKEKDKKGKSSKGHRYKK